MSLFQRPVLAPAGGRLPRALALSTSPRIGLKAFTRSDGLGTLEVVIIIAVLITIALLFNQQITRFAQSLFQKVFDVNHVVKQIGGR